MRHGHLILVVLGLVLTLGAANYDIIGKQRIVDDGVPVLLELRPADPRSLLQGDYMSLRYAPTALPPDVVADSLPRRGIAIVKLDAAGVARFARLDDGAALGEGELRLAYKRRPYESALSYGPDAFFFQEGQADRYAEAEYGVLHVDARGNAVLVGLADRERNLIATR